MNRPSNRTERKYQIVLAVIEKPRPEDVGELILHLARGK
jgi:hypothetical protein